MRLTQALPLILAMLTTTAAPAQFANTINDNANYPAAPVGAINIVPQNDNGRPAVNVTHYAIYPTIQVPCPSSGDLSAPVAAAMTLVSATLGGIVDARRCQGATTWATAITITKPNTVLLLPCAQIIATQTFTVAGGTRNTTIRGCSYQGGSNNSGAVGGTNWNWQGTGTAFLIGDPTRAVDTSGFSFSDAAIVTANGLGGGNAFAFYRTQEIDMTRLYLIGDNGTDQNGIILDGKGNYTGGSFTSIHITGYGSGLVLAGDSTGGANASTFSRVHIDCPTSGGFPNANTTGINLLYGDGNTFSGGDVEGCATMLALGAGASDNTFVGVRNENSTVQISAVIGSQYNLWLNGGTLFTGQLIDNGLHNSFWDSFHREFNNLNGDLWRSQADTTVIDHIYTGIGLGNVRGRQEEWQEDAPGQPGTYQNAWIWGPGDGTTGLQTWVLQDLLSNVLRFSVGQYTTGGGNAQTSLSAAGTGAVIFNGATNAGTGGVVFSSGGLTPSTVATIDHSGNQTLLGQINFNSGSTTAWSFECANTASCSIHNANATNPFNVFTAFTNAGTDINSQAAAAVTVNNSSGAGTGGFIVYEGGTNSNTAAFTISGTGSFTAPGNAQVGSASGTGNITLGNHLNQLATGDFAGSCAMSSGTTCHVSLQHSYTAAVCFANDQTANVATVRAYYQSGDCMVVANSSNSDTWGCMCIGNPS